MKKYAALKDYNYSDDEEDDRFLSKKNYATSFRMWEKNRKQMKATDPYMSTSTQPTSFFSS